MCFLQVIPTLWMCFLLDIQHCGCVSSWISNPVELFPAGYPTLWGFPAGYPNPVEVFPAGYPNPVEMSPAGYPNPVEVFPAGYPNPVEVFPAGYPNPVEVFPAGYPNPVEMFPAGYPSHVKVFFLLDIPTHIFNGGLRAAHHPGRFSLSEHHK